MTTNLKWIAALLLLAAVLTIGIFTGRAQIQDKFNLYKLEMAEKAVKTSEEYRKKEKDWNNQLQEAQKDANKRETQIRADLDNATADNRRLRNTISGLSDKLSRASADARLEAAITGLTLFGECTEAYIDVAEAADRHASDARALSEAWPTYQ